VNDSINSIIQVNLTDEGTMSSVDDGLIYGTIGKSENYFYAINIGGGLYNLTLDTTGLNATIGGLKTLYITGSASNYSNIDINVTIFIDKIPTQITLQNVDPVYAEGDISILATMEKVIELGNPKPNNYGTLIYYIYQNTTQESSSSLEFLMNGVYTSDISLAGLTAGSYIIYVNGTAFNCEDGQSNNVSLTILPQDSSDLDISIPTTIRILKQFQITTTLTYSKNGSGISSQIVNLNISVGSEDPFIIATVTDTDGESTYDYIIAEQHETKNITIKAIYDGQTKIAASQANISQVILGKVPITLNITAHPNNEDRVGYSATYSVQIGIDDESVNNRLIIFNAYYEYVSVNSTPFLTQQLNTNGSGVCGYTIPEIAEGYDNITVFFEYLGSTTVAYNITNITDNLKEKWYSFFDYNITDEDGDSIFRYGEIITFSMKFNGNESGVPIFSGIPVDFTFEFGGLPITITQYVSSNNTLVYVYKIPDTGPDHINITLNFKGSNKIRSTINTTQRNINDKIIVTLTWVELPSIRYISGTHFIAVYVAIEDNSPLPNIELIFKLFDSNGIERDSASSTTNVEGIASVSLNFEQMGDGFYITVNFAESGFYQGSELTSKAIKITNELGAFIEDYGLIIAILAMAALGAYFFITYGYVRPKQRREREVLKLMYQKLSDAENLQYILIIEKEGGVPCFSKGLTAITIDESLVSGFLTAISAFGAEMGSKISEKKAKTGLEELSYGQFKIIIYEGRYVNVALVLIKRPSETLKTKLKQFIQVFEERFKEQVENFTGQVLSDLSVTPLIEEVFEIDLLYPHQAIERKIEDYSKELSKKDLKNKILRIAQEDEFELNFYLRDMINQMKTRGFEEIKTFDSLEHLKGDKIVFALNPRTNMLIQQLQPFLRFLTDDDKKVLFAVFDGATDIISIRKYLKKNQIELSPESDLTIILQKLQQREIINADSTITQIGSAVATLLRLIPDL
jgi:hypothetical protein